MTRHPFVWLCAVSLVCSACGPGSSGGDTRPDSPAYTASVPVTEPSALGLDPGAAVQQVVGRTGPGGSAFSVALRTGGPSHARRIIGLRSFEVALRPAVLGQQQLCTSCHIGANVSRQRAEDSHQDIQPAHPSEALGACSVCHVRTDVSRLVLQGSETTGLDQAYRLCAQCHSPQAEAWAGGAHGKRLAGWRGERVVMSCADCHDPHAPVLPRRIPFRGPILP